MKETSNTNTAELVNLIREKIKETQDLDGLWQIDTILDEWMQSFRIYDFVANNDIETITNLLEALESGHVTTFLMMVGATEWPEIPAEIYAKVEQEWQEFHAELSAARQALITTTISLLKREIYQFQYRWSDQRKAGQVNALNMQINDLIRREDAQLRENIVERDISIIIQEESRLIDALYRQAIAECVDLRQAMADRIEHLLFIRKELVASLTDDILSKVKQIPCSQQTLLWHMIKMIDKYFMHKDANEDTETFDMLYTYGIRAMEMREAYEKAYSQFVSLRADILSQVDQLPVRQRQWFSSQEKLFWRMIEIIDEYSITQHDVIKADPLTIFYNNALYFDQMRANYNNVYLQFTSYNNEYNNFFNFLSQNQSIVTTALDEVTRYFHSFAINYLFENGEVAETNMASFRHGLWNLGLRLVEERSIRAYVEDSRFEVLQRSDSDIEDEIASLTEDRQAVFLYRVRFEENQLIHQTANRDIHNFLSYYINDDGFASAYRALLQRVLTEMRDDNNEFTQAILHYNEAYHNVRSALNHHEETSQNSRNDLFDEHMINLIMSRAITDPTVEFFHDYLLFLYGHQPLTEQVSNALSSHHDALGTALLNYNEAYNNFLHSLNHLEEGESQNYRNEAFNARLINIIMSGDVATPTVEFFSDYLFYVYGGHFVDMATNEQSADREQAHATYQAFLNHFIEIEDFNEYEEFWSSLNQLETIAAVHQAIQQRIIADASRNQIAELDTYTEDESSSYDEGAADNILTTLGLVAVTSMIASSAVTAE